MQWDPKISTLPGLYLLSVGVLKPVSFLVGEDVCNVSALRFINLCGCIVNFYLLYCIQGKLQQCSKDLSVFCLNLLSAVNIATFPVLYFFTFLYYTDTMSVMLVLLTYLLHLEKSNMLASATGFLSVLVRQTNVIWMVFFAALSYNEVLQKHLLLIGRKVSSKSQRHFNYFELIRINMNFMSVMKKELFGYTVVVIGYLFFFVANGSIEMGDRTMNRFVFNFPQLMYFALFSTVFSFPYFVAHLGPFLKFVSSHKILTMFNLLIGIFIIRYFTYVDPLLLEDERHITFYVWKTIYETCHAARYGLMPVYYFGFYSMYRIFKHNSIICKMSYAVCITYLLVPDTLLDFRSFIIPYIIMRLQFNQKQPYQIVCEFILYCFTNILILYLFLTRVLYLKDSDEPQRFVW